jgi:hypothetical protein
MSSVDQRPISVGPTNGTSLNDNDRFLPNGEQAPLSDGDRLHVGAWTTITITLGQ